MSGEETKLISYLNNKKQFHRINSIPPLESMFPALSTFRKHD